MRVMFSIALLLVVNIVASAQTITLDSQGRLIKDSQPYRAIGVNYVDAFWRVMANPEDTSYRQGFADLEAEKIPFARIAAIPFWPNTIREYQTDRETYLERLDDVVRAAEEHNVGLVMSLF